MRLTKLLKNDNGKISNIYAGNDLNERLLEFGFTRGAFIKFLFEFNSTSAFEIRNTVVALRNEDAEKISIEREE